MVAARRSVTLAEDDVQRFPCWKSTRSAALVGAVQFDVDKKIAV